ncbi:MAG: PIN domain-containing protein [Spirosomaceae bacterium]|jgi:predicted nucleic acid-binding protein|nr:PIN domain-containing protein [Spirosomataceae bacterium]
MTIVSNSKIFIDTNILFYANNPSDEFGAIASDKINALARSNNELIISGQILREYAAVTFRNSLYHKLKMSEIIPKVLGNIEVFRSSFTVIYEDDEIVSSWIELLPKITTSKDVFDFNIAATLKVAGIEYIFTHNVSDFEKFSDWLTVIPLVE